MIISAIRKMANAASGHDALTLSDLQGDLPWINLDSEAQSAAADVLVAVLEEPPAYWDRFDHEYEQGSLTSKIRINLVRGSFPANGAFLHQPPLQACGNV
jgi:hypothetical protein